MPQAFVTSDTHLGHPKVALIRGFESSDHHDSVVMRNWCRVVRPEADVYLIGDAFMGPRAAGLAKFATLPGKKHLVLGNHDRPHPLNDNGHKYLREFLEVFETVTTAVQLKRDGLKLMLSHFPYDGDHTDEERYTRWRLRDEGKVLLHGHTHSSEKVSYSEASTPQLHVGVDAWGMRPVELGEVLAHWKATFPSPEAAQNPSDVRSRHDREGKHWHWSVDGWRVGTSSRVRDHAQPIDFNILLAQRGPLTICTC